MSKVIGIIHTTPTTIDILKEQINIYLPDSKVFNIVDDSILPSLINKSMSIEKIKQKWFSYAKYLSELDCDIIISACSSVGEIAEDANKFIGKPVIRIDDEMANQAVLKGSKIAILATLNTTLEPTKNLIFKKAKQISKEIKIESYIVENAFEELTKGNKEKHNQLVTEMILKLKDLYDVIVLAQASMFNIVKDNPKLNVENILTSPSSGIRKIKEILESK